jgi:hypothetical protein
MIQRRNGRRAPFVGFHFDKSYAGTASCLKVPGDNGASHGAMCLEQPQKTRIIDGI